nr:pyridoxamine 5'-phosphate oxidase [Tomitella biformata]
MEAAVADGWLSLLRQWIEDATVAGLNEPNAMVLATVDADSRPSTRTVLCKGLDGDGVRWFTNYGSGKGQDLALRPYASVTFPWLRLYRQVHLRGPVHKLTDAQVQEYWADRPRGAQLGAWASAQSRPIASRAALEAQFAAVAARFDKVAQIPVPDGWGGYQLAPERVEFWQGGKDRLHHRIRLTAGDGGWSVEHLQP